MNVNINLDTNIINTFANVNPQSIDYISTNIKFYIHKINKTKSKQVLTKCFVRISFARFQNFLHT